MAMLLSSGNQSMGGLTLGCGAGEQALQLPKNPVLAAMVTMERLIGAVKDCVCGTDSSPSPAVLGKSWSLVLPNTSCRTGRTSAVCVAYVITANLGWETLESRGSGDFVGTS